MNVKENRRAQLECLYDMFRDRIEENVVYIVYTENEGKIDTVIDQLMSIAKCSFTGHDFEQKSTLALDQNNGRRSNVANNVHKTLASAATNSQVANRTTTRSQTATTTLAKKDQNNLTAVNNNEENNIQVDEDDERLDVDARIASLQASIDNLLMEKESCHEKASHYLSKKMFPVTSYYSELASQYRRSIDAKTRKLIDLLLLKSQNANSIDLHGLNPIQARLVVSELLNIRLDKLSIDKQGEASIDIITGWGKHTVTNSQHRIRPTIVALLKEKHFEYYHLNKGALRVTIRR